MSRREPTPNYQLMFESVVGALQNSYAEYKKAAAEELRWTFFDHDGNFCFLSGYEKRRKQVEDAKEEVARLLKEVKRLRELKGGDDK